VKPSDVMVNIVGAAFCNAILFYVLLKQVKLIVVKKWKKWGVFVLLNAVRVHPVECSSCASC
jgi:hypothetical protein